MKRLLAVLAASWIPFAGAAFKCTDAKGITHIGDTPPAGCKEVMMYEVTPSGKVLREIEPTLTPEQAKARAAELEKKRAADAIAAEQKRKDLALLSTYASEKEFDVARDRNIEPLRGRITSTQERIKAAEKKQKDIQDEMEFYKAGKAKKGGEMPANLTDDLKRAQAEKTALQSTIAGYEKEIEEIKVKFDADKKRWMDLKNAPKEAAATDTKAAKKN
jgi:predicted  nucleic acid-binding Zn-ribbon protein